MNQHSFKSCNYAEGIAESREVEGLGCSSLRFLLMIFEIVNLHTRNFVTLKTSYGSETMIPLFITGCRDKIYSE